MVSVFVYHDVALARLGQDLTRSLHIQPPPIVPQLDDDAHRLAFTREGYHLHYICRVSGLLEVGPTELTREIEQSGLGLVANDHRIPILILILERGRIDRDRLVEEFAEWWRQDRIQIDLVD